MTRKQGKLPQTVLSSLIWISPFIFTPKFVEEIHNLCLYYIAALFVTLRDMRKLFLGLHCAGNLYMHLLESEAKGQVNDMASVYQL